MALRLLIDGTTPAPTVASVPPPPPPPSVPPPVPPAPSPPPAPAPTPAIDPSPPSKGLSNAAWHMLPPDDQNAVAIIIAQGGDSTGLPSAAIALANTAAIQKAAQADPPDDPNDPLGKKKKRAEEAARLGPFAGVGVFLDYHPEVMLRAHEGIDWVAIRPDLVGPDWVSRLRGRGYDVHLWEAQPSGGQSLIDLYGATGWIGQAEGPGQLNGALALGESIRGAKALVTNLFMSKFPTGWVALPEAYRNVNPSASVFNVSNRAKDEGATAIAPVLGIYDAHSEGGSKLGVSDYDADLKRAVTNSFSLFHGEELDDSDFAYLRNRKQAVEPAPTPKPATTPGTAKPPVILPGGEIPGVTPPTVGVPIPTTAQGRAPDPASFGALELAWNDLMRAIGLTWTGAADNARAARKRVVAAVR